MKKKLNRIRHPVQWLHFNYSQRVKKVLYILPSSRLIMKSLFISRSLSGRPVFKSHMYRVHISGWDMRFHENTFMASASPVPSKSSWFDGGNGTGQPWDGLDPMSVYPAVRIYSCRRRWVCTRCSAYGTAEKHRLGKTAAPPSEAETKNRQEEIHRLITKPKQGPQILRTTWTHVSSQDRTRVTTSLWIGAGGGCNMAISLRVLSAIASTATEIGCSFTRLEQMEKGPWPGGRHVKISSGRLYAASIARWTLSEDISLETIREEQKRDDESKRFPQRTDWRKITNRPKARKSPHWAKKNSKWTQDVHTWGCS